MNKIKLRLSENQKSFTIPLKINFDGLGRDDLVKEYEDKVTEEVINPIDDFELTRFGHKTWLSGETSLTKLNYKFFFYNREVPVDTTNSSNINNWVNSYNFTTIPEFTGTCFSDKEIYYYANSFKRSFFKLDLYDTPNSETQKIYLTIIIPTQQGVVTQSDIGTETVPLIVDIKTPNMVLDYIGDKEGFFIYWLKNIEDTSLTEFYMSAKFFNAKIGQFIRLTTLPQSNFSKKYNLQKDKYFYRKVELDYDNYEYIIKNVINGNRVGTNGSINWYEYVNPS